MISGTDKADAAVPEAADTSIAPAGGEATGGIPSRADATIVDRRRSLPRAGSRDARVKEGNVGSALRSVYQQTVNEDVPDDLMQLLGKLS